MSEAEPIFYLRDSDESDEELGDAAVLRERRSSQARRPPAARHRRSNSSSKAVLARSVWELEDRCAALESEVERATAQRELLASKLIWLEDKVRTLAAVSSRTSRIYWDWGRRDASAAAVAAAAAAAAYFDDHDANPRPRSQYEHAPRRDHAFNRQRLPPPPPPLVNNGIDAAISHAAAAGDAAGAGVGDDASAPLSSAPFDDDADLSARVGAFLADSDRLLARFGVPADSAADNDVDVRDNDVDDQHEDEFEALRSRVMLERDLLSQMHATRQPRRPAKQQTRPR
jgi:uncharacterized small protein (DUF1192 family)